MLWEYDFQVPAADGGMPTFVVSAARNRPLPLVILYMDVWGIREELRQIARDVAVRGYCCALPDLFYREGTVRHEFRDANGRMIRLEKLSAADKERVRAPLRNLTDPMVMQDTAKVIEFAGVPGLASGRNVAVIGYCMGGVMRSWRPVHFRTKCALRCVSTDQVSWRTTQVRRTGSPPRRKVKSIADLQRGTGLRRRLSYDP